MHDLSNIYKAIDKLAQNEELGASGKAKRRTITLPEELIKLIDYYKNALGYSTFSSAVKAIIESYFVDLERGFKNEAE